MDRPVPVFLVTLSFLVVLGLPFLHVRFNAPDASILPAFVPSRVAYDSLVADFPIGDFGPLTLAVETDGPVTDPANVGLLYDYSRRIAADPRVERVESIVDVDPRLGREQYQLILSNPAGPADRFVANALARTTDGDLTAFNVVTWYGSNDAEARALVRDLRDPGVRARTTRRASGCSWVAVRRRSWTWSTRSRADFPRTALFILVTTYLILLLLLRSVVLPAKALVMNTLSILASFGALVWIFQDGNLSGPLGFLPPGYVETTMPVILFCVLFGLSMDYEVFLLSRMKETWDRTGDNREAVASGLERSGRIVTSAAAIVVLVAGVVRVRGCGAHQGAGHRRGARRGARRHRRPGAAGALHDAPAGSLELVDARPHAPLARIAAAGGGGMRLPASRVALAAPARWCVVGLWRTHPRQPAADHVAHRAAVPDAAACRRTRSRSMLPRDDGPHDRLTEWWYDTGHLVAADGRRFGFEMVIFRAERGDFPVTWASHLAITDEHGQRFLYDQRSEVGSRVDRSEPARASTWPSGAMSRWASRT